MCSFAQLASLPTLAASEVNVVVVPALHRVMRDDVQVEGGDSVALSIAQGETESAQIVVANRGRTPLKSVDLSWTKLSGPDGPAPIIRPYREHYVHVTESSAGQKSRLGWYPDALIPFVDPYTGTRPKPAKYSAWGAEIPPGEVQGYWLDVEVPRQAVAGEYRGMVRVTGEHDFVRDVKVVVKVWDFALPETPSLPTHFGIGRARIAAAFGLSPSSVQLADLQTKAESLLEQHRLTILGIPPVPADRASGHARCSPTYLMRLREIVSRRKLKICALPLTADWPFPDAFGADFERLKVYLRDLDQMLRDNPWIPPVFICMFDEPRTPEAYAKLHRLGAELDAQSSKLLNLVPGALEPKPGWANLDDAIDIWVYHIGHWDQASVAARQEAGKHVWCYTALKNNRNSTPSWLLDGSPVEYMVPFWASWSLRLEGILYWTVMASGEATNPWTDPVTYTTAAHQQFNGEGFLVLSGVPAGVNGPVPTIRLKVVRDGLDCYDYLWLLAQRTGQASSDQIAHGLVQTFTQWNPDRLAYMAAREQLAAGILSNSSASLPLDLPRSTSQALSQ